MGVEHAFVKHASISAEGAEAPDSFPVVAPPVPEPLVPPLSELLVPPPDGWLDVPLEPDDETQTPWVEQVHPAPQSPSEAHE